MRASFGGSRGGSETGTRATRVWLLSLLALSLAPAFAQDSYWYAGGRRYPLPVSDTYLAVQTRTRAAAEQLARGVGLRAGLSARDSDVTVQRPVALLAAPTVGGGTSALRQAAVANPEVVRVLPVYGRGRYALIATEEILVGFRGPLSAASQADFSDRYQVDFIGPMPRAVDHGWVIRVRDQDRQVTLEVANRIYEDGEVAFCHPNFMPTYELRQTPRLIPNDPLFSFQWHLNATGQLGTLPDADVNAPAAWDLELGSPNIVVAVIDSGVDTAHPDFAAPGKIVNSFDVIDNDTNPYPDGLDAHGTACAGVIGAVANNNRGLSGVAPGVGIMGIRMLDFGYTLLDEAEAIDYAANNGADVISNSWGPADGLGIPQPLPDSTRVAIDFAADSGRGGLGCVIFWAAGNGDESADLDGYASYDKVISVAASTDQDLRSFYSDFGTTVDICAPSNGGINGIATTDISGPDGYSSGDYTNQFGGTSSAAPLAAGVAALVLSVDPSLDRVAVQQLLQDTARKIDTAGGGYDVNGHSDLYGFGKVDAEGAVIAASGGLGTQVTLEVQTMNLNSPNFPGVQPTTTDTAIVVSYVNGRGNPSTVEVFDGTPVTVGCQPGSTVSYAAVDKVSAASTGGAGQRWMTAAPVSAVISDQPVSLIGTYYHQLRRNFRAQVQAGARDIDAAHAVPITLSHLGQPLAETITSTTKRLYGDTGSLYTVAAEASNNGTEERWLGEDTRTANETPGVPDGNPDTVTGRISQQQPEVAPKFFHQVMVRVALNGTNSSSVVSTTRRRLLGRDALVSNLFGQFQRFCDNQSPIAFSASSTGSPVLQASGPREFTVAPGLDETISYVIQPQVATSTVRVFDRNVLARTEVASTTAPANNRTPVEVVVTIRDSAGSPVTGILPERVSLFPDPLDGVTVTDPASATDSTGRLIFQVTASMPLDVTFTATLDGQLINSAASAAYLQVLTVPLALPGTYLVSFPITPADSHRAILDFNTTPSPPQMARLIDGTSQYEFFRADGVSTSFNIVPGRGFFLRTQTSGAAELTGPRAVGPTFDLPMGPRGFHQLGNPQATDRMIWRLADFEVFQNGVSVGLLSNSSTWQFVDPFVWSFNGTEYELVVDPVFPGTDGLRSQVGVFEGFFWRSLQDGVTVVYTPDSGRSRSAEAPLSPANFGVSLTAATADGKSTVVVGAQRQAVRASAAPESPLEEGDAVRVELLGADGGRSAADYVGTAVVGPTTWRLQVTSRAAGEPVTLSWPHLSRQLPAGYRARLVDPTNGKSLLLNTHSSYVFTSNGQPREFELTVLPRSTAPLSVVQFQPAASRGRSVSFEATVSGEAELFLRVTSLAGRLVAETSPVTTAGTAMLAWDGRDSSGRPVPRGTYQVTLIARNADGETVRAQRTLTVH